ncbi:MAG: hypothetical protein AUH85_10055 [Chloroflexi bacterium 13_1_40CM_4_68_4]|nr:MAG: hypothetical protein AUH85_10055 [Chloroflexi bacterium 13_1_40CM_4_68_4]
MRAADMRLLLEDVCSDIVRYLHANGRPDAFASVDIDREWNLGIPSAFADLRVKPADGREYLVEIKTGYTTLEVVEHLRRKYSASSTRLDRVARVVLVVARADHPDWSELERRVRGAVRGSIAVEIWDDERINVLVGELFGVSLGSLSDEHDLVQVRAEIYRAKLRLGLGRVPTDPHELVLADSLLWHLGFWRVRELIAANANGGLSSLVPARHYEGVVALFADLCSFSAFVRDTPHEEIVRSSLTAFYSRARYQIINEGGMIYQFVGDEVTAFFGIPDQRDRYVEAALRTALSLVEIARSVEDHWQRRIDKLQVRSGIHVGMAMGDISLVAQRPFDVARLGAFGDTLNLAARLRSNAGPDEIVISNVLKESMPDGWDVDEHEPVEAHNVGLVRAWCLRRNG